MPALRVLTLAIVAAFFGCTSGPLLPPVAPKTPQADEAVLSIEHAALDATVILYAGAPSKRRLICAGVHITPVLILTAQHCLDGATEYDGKVWYRHRGDDMTAMKSSTVVGSDEYTDLGLLEASEPHAVWLRVGEAKRGAPVFAVGHPLGIAWTLTRGKILSWYTTIEMTPWGEFKVTEFAESNTAVKPGSSGGPLVNAAGEVVGIASWYKPTMGLSYFVSWKELVTFLEGKWKNTKSETTDPRFPAPRPSRPIGPG